MIIENKVWIPLIAVIAALAAGIILMQGDKMDGTEKMITASPHPSAVRPSASADPDEGMAALLEASAEEDALLNNDEGEESALQAQDQVTGNPDELFYDITY